VCFLIRGRDKLSFTKTLYPNSANAVLGYLPHALLGGTFKLDFEASKRAVQIIADAVGLTLHEAAEGILKLANEKMYGALKSVSVERVRTPLSPSYLSHLDHRGTTRGNIAWWRSEELDRSMPARWVCVALPSRYRVLIFRQRGCASHIPRLSLRRLEVGIPYSQSSGR
jgi:hypothetical protein